MLNNPRNHSNGRPSDERRIRVAIVISSLGFGGAERQVVEITKHLDRTAFDVFLVSLSPHLPLLDDNPELRADTHLVQKKWKFDFTVVFRLASLLKRLEIDIAHAFMFDSEMALAIATMITDTKVVIMSERNANYRMRGLHRYGRSFAMRRATHCVANSCAGAAFNASITNQPLTKYSVVENGVDTNIFRPHDKVACRTSLNISESTFVIGMFASFKPQKNHKMFLKSLHSLSEMGMQPLVLLVGDSLSGNYQRSVEYKKDIQNRIHELGISSMIRVLGARTDLAELYSACDVTVLPSFHEGTPNVVLESLSCNVPVVVTDVSDNRRIVDGIDGCYVIPSDSSDDLVSVLSDLIRNVDSASIKTMTNARAVVEDRYSIPKMASRIADVYKMLYARHSGVKVGGAI